VPTITTRGPARVTVTELGGPRLRGLLIALAVAAVLIAAGSAWRHQSVREAVTIAVPVAVGLAAAAVAVMAWLIVRRIRTTAGVRRPAPSALSPLPRPAAVAPAPAARSLSATTRPAIAAAGTGPAWPRTAPLTVPGSVVRE
jgi:hypothetical protein